MDAFFPQDDVRLCLMNASWHGDLVVAEDPRTVALKHYAYGVALPLICSLGIVGNILNLVVLTRRNMKGIAYIYMRGYSAASLLAIAFAIPFGLRVLIHKESGGWTSLPQAFYHAHLELFLGNACLGVGVMMLLALTVERYASVCRPGRRSPPPPLAAPPHRATAAAFLIPVITFILYLPNVFRAQLTRCLTDKGLLIYQKRDNSKFLHSLFFSVYKCALEVMFKIGPTLLLAGLNLRIMVVYRRSCERRRQMTLKPSGEESRKFAEEQRLVLLLGSTSILFFVCVSPMAILNVTLSERNLNFYSYQVFRAIANVLEVTNYSITFYIYCLFSEDFRNTLIRTFQCPSDSGSKAALPAPRLKASAGKGNVMVPMSGVAAVPTTTTTTATAGIVMGGTLSSTEEGWMAISGALQKARRAWKICACMKEASPGGSSADRVIV